MLFFLTFFYADFLMDLRGVLVSGSVFVVKVKMVLIKYCSEAKELLCHCFCEWVVFSLKEANNFLDMKILYTLLHKLRVSCALFMVSEF